jgi:hypothetical protein
MWNHESATYVALALIVVLVAVALFDLAAGASGGKLISVTSVVKAWAKAYPVLPFGVGMLVGHLFW